MSDGRGPCRACMCPEFQPGERNERVCRICPQMHGRSQHVEAGQVQPTRRASRVDDPHTSHEASEAITDSGKRATLAAQVLAFVRANPGLTGGEIGQYSGLGHDRVWRRLSDLKNKGEIQMVGYRAWQGRKQGTWYPASHEGVAGRSPPGII